MSATSAIATHLLLSAAITLAGADPQGNTTVHEDATKAAASTAGVDDQNERRCAFLGRQGAFTLLGSTGTAAYRLGDENYIADLQFDREDPTWWIYNATGNGDPLTSQWAFARKPRCGLHTVLRYSGGKWIEFERTNAWGQFNAAQTVAKTVQPSNQELLDKLRDIEDKLKLIQPARSPSLDDLQQEIKAKP